MNAKHHERRGGRSRLLGSIFAPAPHSASLMGEQPSGASCGLNPSPMPRTAARSSEQKGWRDVTASLERAEMAEGICTRFFADPPYDAQEACSGRLDGGMATAGQRLQALSTERHEGELSGIDLAALLRGVARGAESTVAPQPQSAGAYSQSLVTAKAA
jgi:hypothetical protein